MSSRPHVNFWMHKCFPALGLCWMNVVHCLTPPFPLYFQNKLASIFTDSKTPRVLS
jgi:hypothetical protein